MENMESQYDEQEETITIVDEDGIERECVILDIMEYEAKRYVALVLEESFDKDPDKDEEPTDLFIMEIVDDGDCECLQPIDSPEEYTKISNIMIERLSQDFDIEE